MLNWVWSLMFLAGLIFGAGNGSMSETVQAITTEGGRAIETVLKMCAGFVFWCGLMEILDESGFSRKLSQWMEPLIGRLFPGVRKSETLTAITMNLTANMLGLGNAATPMGLLAMEGMAAENGLGKQASHAMCLFLVINSCCVQLIPSTVIALRTAAGSADPGGILWPTLCATGISAAVGILLCQMCSRRRAHE